LKTDDETLEEARSPQRRASADAPLPALAVVWLDGQPSHLGGVILASAEAAVFGRGEGEGERRALIIRQTPGANVELGPVKAPWLSRRQLRIQALDDRRIMIESLGKLELKVRGASVAQAVVAPGEHVTLGERALLLATLRPALLPAPRDWSEALHDSGAPDPFGLVGESAALWALRDRVAFIARQRGHVLVLGPSGAGKERVAQALHRLSPRRARPLVARNAATIPTALMDVELFGHVANFPNPGMRERAGMVGEADGSTLMLDELGELSDELQAHLLRLMDSGEYQRLGDPKPRVADVRLIGATNRDPEELKPDLRARFRHVVRVPPLDERREDIGLLARHIVRSAAREDPRLAAQLFVDGEPRFELALLAALLVHPLSLQVRELEGLLWDALAQATGDRISCPDTLRRVSVAAAPSDEQPTPELTRDELQAAIERHDGVLEKVWRELGLRNRYVLRRLLTKHGIKAASD